MGAQNIAMSKPPSSQDLGTRGEDPRQFAWWWAGSKLRVVQFEGRGLLLESGKGKDNQQGEQMEYCRVPHSWCTCELRMH